MISTHAIEVPLPEGIEPTASEQALVDVLCRAVFALRPTEGETCWARTARALRDRGWDVTWRLMWVAAGRRAGHIEEGAGATLDEAFGRLQELTLLDEVEGCP